MGKKGVADAWGPSCVSCSSGTPPHHSHEFSISEPLPYAASETAIFFSNIEIKKPLPGKQYCSITFLLKMLSNIWD